MLCESFDDIAKDPRVKIVVDKGLGADIFFSVRSFWHWKRNKHDKFIIFIIFNSDYARYTWAQQYRIDGKKDTSLSSFTLSQN